MQSPAEIIVHVTRVLDGLGIPYALVGSFASTAHGFPRATNDADILADIKPAQVEPLVASLSADFYVDETVVRRAVSSHRSFNAIHFDTAFKIDFFIPPPEGFDLQQLARRRPSTALSPEESQRVYLASAEDTVLAKLRWYRKGDEVSERQWSDVIGILKVGAGNLDADYMRDWAGRLGVDDLLDKALKEATEA